jgi:hypothetical protein
MEMKEIADVSSEVLGPLTRQELLASRVPHEE